jgi:thiol-disulfide isomerase/thioredoxin
MTTPIKLVFYTRSGCHLCDEAAIELSKLGEQFPLDVRSVDIDDDEEIRERYNDSVPAVDVDGAVVSSAPLDWTAIRTAIQSAAG